MFVPENGMPGTTGKEFRRARSAYLKYFASKLPRPLTDAEFRVLAGDYIDFLDEGNVDVENELPKQRETLPGYAMRYFAARTLYRVAKLRLLAETKVIEPHKGDDSLEDYVRRRRGEMNQKFDELIPLYADTHKSS